MSCSSPFDCKDTLKKGINDNNLNVSISVLLKAQIKLNNTSTWTVALNLYYLFYFLM